MAYLKEEIKAGVIIVASFLILSGFVILIGGSQVFEKLDFYYVKVMNAAGVDEGAQVKLGGVRVGRVLSITPPTAPGEPVTIKVGIKKGTVLYKGTKASITQVGFVGDIYLLFSIDKTTKEQFKAGDTIPADEQVQFAVLMARLDSISQSVDGLIKDIDMIFSERNIKEIESLLKNANSAIVSGSSNLDKVASALKGTTAKLELALNEVEGLVKDNKAEVSQLIRRAREGVEKAGDMIRTIEAAAKSADATIKTADRAIDRQSQNLDILLNTLNRTTEDLRDALQEIKSKPWSVVYKEGQGKEE
ncbi:MAG: MlaD family protein [Nitrospirae bacterium]|nr:MlaD family protein [Nitrospirota bacterium]MCL5421889.1 MlaD family protein [Nitrospirota bacterium]